ncbi:hypothetical protein OAJ60_00465 [Planctomycetaceae bacterium]|nr:hypothetical protein [Planctomycetaceae bacterium]
MTKNPVRDETENAIPVDALGESADKRLRTIFALVTIFVVSPRQLLSNVFRPRSDWNFRLNQTGIRFSTSWFLRNKLGGFGINKFPLRHIQSVFQIARLAFQLIIFLLQQTQLQAVLTVFFFVLILFLEMFYLRSFFLVLQT